MGVCVFTSWGTVQMQSMVRLSQNFMLDEITDRPNGKINEL
jgi:hypothetical protein